MAKQREDNPKDMGGQDGGAERGEAVERAVEQAAAPGRRAGDTAQQQAAEATKHQGDQWRNVLDNSAQYYRDVAELSRDDVEAFFQSSARMARGMQEVVWEMINLTQENVSLGAKHANSLLQCRSIEDAFARQRDFLKETVNSLMSCGAKVLQMSTQVTNEAVAPINQRVADNDSAGRGAPRRGERPGQATTYRVGELGAGERGAGTEMRH